jgi:hypothetical protein
MYTKQQKVKKIRKEYVFCIRFIQSKISDCTPGVDKNQTTGTSRQAYRQISAIQDIIMSQCFS